MVGMLEISKKRFSELLEELWCEPEPEGQSIQVHNLPRAVLDDLKKLCSYPTWILPRGLSENIVMIVQVCMDAITCLHCKCSVIEGCFAYVRYEKAYQSYAKSGRGSYIMGRATIKCIDCVKEHSASSANASPVYPYVRSLDCTGSLCEALHLTKDMRRD